MCEDNVAPITRTTAFFHFTKDLLLRLLNETSPSRLCSVNLILHRSHSGQQRPERHNAFKSNTICALLGVIAPPALMRSYLITSPHLVLRLSFIPADAKSCDLFRHALVVRRKRQSSIDRAAN